MSSNEEFMPISGTLSIYLADDDEDDRMLFKEALDELPVSAKLTTFANGEQLMGLLCQRGARFPDVIFLDLNMPLKNGFVSLGEIKRHFELQDIPVIIFSTTNEQEAIKQVFRDAAHYYIIKPAEFSDLKNVIYEVLTLIAEKNISLPSKEEFVLSGHIKTNPD